MTTAENKKTHPVIQQDIMKQENNLDHRGYITARPIIESHPGLTNFSDIMQSLPPDEWYEGIDHVPQPDLRSEAEHRAEEVYEELYNNHVRD